MFLNNINKYNGQVLFLRIIYSMKTIKLSEYKGYGKLINLETDYISYEKLIFEPEKYFNRYTTYYVYCKHGFKSSEVVNALNNKGYNAIQIIND